MTIVQILMSVKGGTTAAVRPVSILLDHTTATASVAFRGLEPLSVKVGGSLESTVGVG